MSELTGAELDLAVADLLEMEVITDYKGQPFLAKNNALYSPSTNWAQGGPLIEEYRISLAYVPLKNNGVKWYAQISLDDDAETGPTPLIAACRAIVASKEEKNND